MEVQSITSARLDLDFSILHTSDVELGQAVRFPSSVMEVYHPKELVERLQAWQAAADGPAFRQIVALREHPLEYTISHLPDGCVPLSELPTRDFTDTMRISVCVALAEAFARLHKAGFVMGFVPIGRVYCHPKSLEVLIDVQPFPSGIPFVNDFLCDLPGVLFSPYARTYTFSRAADFYAFGILMYWLWAGDYPEVPYTPDFSMPADVRNLCTRLLLHPETFLDMTEVLEELDVKFSRYRPTQLPAALSLMDVLHPAAPPTTPAQEALLRSFLSTPDVQILAVICEDETARMDVIRQHINQVIDRNFFITVTCRNLPFSTMREMIDRMMFNAEKYSDAVKQQKRPLLRKLDTIVERHYEGDNVLEPLAEWLREFCLSVLPALQFQRLYITFENCEELDIESQKVFRHFWRHYSAVIPHFQVIFTGAHMPSGLTNGRIPTVLIEGGDAELYERQILCQCGRVDTGALHTLVQWMVQYKLSPYYVRIALEECIASGQFTLVGRKWQLVDPALPDWISAPEALVLRRVESLAPEDLRMLQIFTCLPSPIRARSVFKANHLDAGHLSTVLRTLSSLQLLRVYHDDSVFVPVEVTSLIKAHMTREARIAVSEAALKMQQHYRPEAIPPLIELARLAENERLEYLFMILYFRQVRFALSASARRDLLVSIEYLQNKLGRTRTCCWRRWLSDAYYRQNQVSEAAETAERQFRASSADQDKFRWMLYSMFAHKVNLDAVQSELLEYVFQRSQSLSDRAYALFVLLRSTSYLPLHKDVADQLHNLYQEDFYPERSRLSTRQFAELTISYAVLLFEYFPEHEDYASRLLEMIEAMLSEGTHLHMMSSPNDAYVYHSNISVCRKYIQRQLDQAQQMGVKLRTQICHLNEMEMSLYQGDLDSYEYHKEQAVLVDEFRRKDLLEQFLMHQLSFSCEWEQWKSFDEILEELRRTGMNQNTEMVVNVYEAYGKYLRGEGKSVHPQITGQDHYSLFLDGLHQLAHNRTKAAAKAFEQSIGANGYHLTAGWSYRELIQLLLASESGETRYWLEQFERYLKKYRYDLFWPDYYYLSAEWQLQSGDLQHALLYFRRAVNGYQVLQKEFRFGKVSKELDAVMHPPYIPDVRQLEANPLSKQLYEDRMQFLNQSLDLLVIVQMSERVTESLDLTETIHRLVDALIEYFPVTHAAVSFQLYHRQERIRFSVSGVMDEGRAVSVKPAPDRTLSYDLYRQGHQSISMELHTQTFWEPTTRRHLLHFLSVIKPHIANAIHYMEMMMDNLTGFYQRRYFVERLDQEFETSLKYGLDLSVLMLDLDNFRQVNEHGHPEGDRVLREVAGLIQSELRPMDIPVRYGGEELLVILPKTEGRTAVRIAQRLRESVEEWFIGHGRPYTVTVSIGVASLQSCKATTADELLSYADAAEIHAKASGKNRVTAAWSAEMLS